MRTVCRRPWAHHPSPISVDRFQRRSRAWENLAFPRVGGLNYSTPKKVPLTCSCQLHQAGRCQAAEQAALSKWVNPSKVVHQNLLETHGQRQCKTSRRALLSFLPFLLLLIVLSRRNSSRRNDLLRTAPSTLWAFIGRYYANCIEFLPPAKLFFPRLPA